MFYDKLLNEFKYETLLLELYREYQSIMFKILKKLLKIAFNKKIDLENKIIFQIRFSFIVFKNLINKDLEKIFENNFKDLTEIIITLLNGKEKEVFKLKINVLI